MFDFISGVVTGVTTVVGAVVDFITGGKDDASGEPDPCDVGNCQEAKEQLANARGDFARACQILGVIKGTVEVAQFIVSRSIVEYVIAFILLTLIFGFAGILIFVGVYLLAWLAIRAFMPALIEAGQNLGFAKENEDMARTEVYYKCPEACHGDLEPSECIHLQETEGGLP